MKDKYTKDKTESIVIRLSKTDKEIIESNSSKYGFYSLSEFIRFIGMNVNISVDTK